MDKYERAAWVKWAAQHGSVAISADEPCVFEGCCTFTYEHEGITLGDDGPCEVENCEAI